MTRVLVIHNILWAHYKGRVFSELFELARSRDVDVFVIHCAITERRRENLGSVDRSLHTYPYRVLSDETFDDQSVWWRIRETLRELKRMRPEVVVLPGYWDLSFWVLLAAARLQGRKVILSCDSTEADKLRYWIRELPKRLFVRCCHGAFTYGQRSARYLAKLGMQRDRITVRCQAAPNAEIRRVFQAALPHRLRIIDELGLRPRNFVYVGRLSSEKNVRRLLVAYSMLRSTSAAAADWGLLIVGDGEERDDLIAMCTHAGFDGVKLYGGVPWNEVPRLFAACDVLVLPSVSEPWGLVVNEAMVCGLPAIVSEACGCVEDLIVPQQTGFTFAPMDTSALRERMAHFVTSPDEVERMGRFAMEFIKGFSPEAAAKQMLGGIERLRGCHRHA